MSRLKRRHATGVPDGRRTHRGATARPATLVVTNPSGTRSRVPIQPVPFRIGRQADNHLVLRDNRASRNHARIVMEAGEYYVEDLKSSHGVFVNGSRVSRQKLYAADRIEFGFPDSYSLIFTFEEDEIHRILDQFSATKIAPASWFGEPGQAARTGGSGSCSAEFVVHGGRAGGCGGRGARDHRVRTRVSASQPRRHARGERGSRPVRRPIPTESFEVPLDICATR